MMKLYYSVLLCLNEGNNRYLPSGLLHQQFLVHPFELLLFQFVGVPPWLLPYGRMARHESGPNYRAGGC